jgi:hypothetical protein
MFFRTQLLKWSRLAAVIVLVGLSLLVAYQNTLSAMSDWDPDRPQNNPVDRWDERIQPIRNHLPEDVTLVGYVADWDIPDFEYNPIDQDAEYVLTQYAMAPIMVKPGLEEEWIIGNFLHPDFEAWLDQSLPSYEIRSLGFGIYLIHRTPP